jgi:hypothetical protein
MIAALRAATRLPSGRLPSAVANARLLPVATRRLCDKPRKELEFTEDWTTGTQHSLTPEAWMNAYVAGKAPPLRFSVGTPVRCFVGGDAWVRGTVIAHHFREASWPASRPSAPYQVLLDDGQQGGRPSNAIWAPADVDEIVRAGFRFGLAETAECRVEMDEWVNCTVMGLLYREKSWPEGRYAPYQVRIDSVLPGALGENAKKLAQQQALIWLPADEDEYIRTASAARTERLQALDALRASGVLDEEDYKDRRREVVHST